MFPDSPFAVPVGSFQVPVPVPDVDPDTGTLVSICLNPAWIPYVIGCLKQLLLQSTWDTTDSGVLNLVQQRATNLIGLFQAGLCEGGMPTILRAEPEGCGIQWSTDNGDTWNTIDLNLCISTIAGNVFDSKFPTAIQDAIDSGLIQGGTAQQSPETPPAVGGCKTFHVHLEGNNRWLCPVPVSQGYTVLVSNASGATWDGDNLSTAWYCPNGQRWLLVDCSDIGAHTDSSDPLNTVNHMMVVGNIASTWFDPFTLYTVPDGIVQQPLYLQVNDSTIADNQGSVDFDVEVCNPEVAVDVSFGPLTEITVTEIGLNRWHIVRPAGGGNAGFWFTRGDVSYCLVAHRYNVTGSPNYEDYHDCDDVYHQAEWQDLTVRSGYISQTSYLAFECDIHIYKAE